MDEDCLSLLQHALLEEMDIVWLTSQHKLDNEVFLYETRNNITMDRWIDLSVLP